MRIGGDNIEESSDHELDDVEEQYDEDDNHSEQVANFLRDLEVAENMQTSY